MAGETSLTVLQQELFVPSGEPVRQVSRLTGLKQSAQKMALTVKDLESGTGRDPEQDFYRSQELYRKMLDHVGINSISVRSVEYTDPVPIGTNIAEAPVEVRRADFTKKIFGQLKSKSGIFSTRMLRRLLHHMDLNGDGILAAQSVEGALTQNGIRMKLWESEALRELFGVPDSAVKEGIDYPLLLAYGYRNWSQIREEAVLEAFAYLSSKCPSNVLIMKAVINNFKPWVLTPELCPGGNDSEQDGSTFLRQWRECMASTDGTLTWEEFCFLYLDMSACVPSEANFVSFVCKSWGMDPDDWLAKKVFLKFCPPDAEEEEETLPLRDFKRMLEVFDNGISEEEADAWYKAIDEDNSGEVSLQEFLNCKVLQAKRLYDDHVASEDRQATKDEIIYILRNLCPDLTRADAVTLYNYADLDGNGSIDFTEFLENQLLKLLQVYQESRMAGSTRKHFSAEEMQNVLKKLDPGLDNSEIQAIYKAVDTDGSGSVSFVEFCQSQVLRAKALFDRFDIDRSRCLTKLKFLEMLRFFNNTWTQEEEQALCDLVVNPHSQKVTLSAFLNPNVIKLKLLFDKYDKDHGKELDREEFKVMLKEIFTAEEKDVEELINFTFPEEKEGQEGLRILGAQQLDDSPGISFLEYIINFKELSRRFDAMVLAKKRKAREKAKSKGLLFKYDD